MITAYQLAQCPQSVFSVIDRSQQDTTIIAGRCKNHPPILRYLIFVTTQPEGRFASRVAASFLLAVWINASRTKWGALASVRKPRQNDAYSPALFPKWQITATLNSTTE